MNDRSFSELLTREHLEDALTQLATDVRITKSQGDEALVLVFNFLSQGTSILHLEEVMLLRLASKVLDQIPSLAVTAPVMQSLVSLLLDGYTKLELDSLIEATNFFCSAMRAPAIRPLVNPALLLNHFATILFNSSSMVTGTSDLSDLTMLMPTLAMTMTFREGARSRQPFLVPLVRALSHSANSHLEDWLPLLIIALSTSCNIFAEEFVECINFYLRSLGSVSKNSHIAAWLAITPLMGSWIKGDVVGNLPEGFAQRVMHYLLEALQKVFAEEPLEISCAFVPKAKKFLKHHLISARLLLARLAGVSAEALTPRHKWYIERREDKTTDNVGPVLNTILSVALKKRNVLVPLDDAGRKFANLTTFALEDRKSSNTVLPLTFEFKTFGVILDWDSLRQAFFDTATTTKPHHLDLWQEEDLLKLLEMTLRDSPPAKYRPMKLATVLVLSSQVAPPVHLHPLLVDQALYAIQLGSECAARILLHLLREMDGWSLIMQQVSRFIVQLGAWDPKGYHSPPSQGYLGDLLQCLYSMAPKKYTLNQQRCVQSPRTLLSAHYQVNLTKQFVSSERYFRHIVYSKSPLCQLLAGPVQKNACRDKLVTLLRSVTALREQQVEKLSVCKLLSLGIGFQLCSHFDKDQMSFRCPSCGQLLRNRQFTHIVCNECERGLVQNRGSMGCANCNYDLCMNCFTAKTGVFHSHLLASGADLARVITRINPEVEFSGWWGCFEDIAKKAPASQPCTRFVSPEHTLSALTDALLHETFPTVVLHVRTVGSPNSSCVCGQNISDHSYFQTLLNFPFAATSKRLGLLLDTIMDNSDDREQSPLVEALQNALVSALRHPLLPFCGLFALVPHALLLLHASEKLKQLIPLSFRCSIIQEAEIHAYNSAFDLFKYEAANGKLRHNPTGAVEVIGLRTEVHSYVHTIDREHIYESARKALVEDCRTYTANIPVRFKFRDEAATGQGPSQEFYSELSVWYSQQPSLWARDGATLGGLIPSHVQVEINTFYTLGKAFGRSRVDGFLMNVRFGPIFWECVDSIVNQPPRDVNVIEKLLAYLAVLDPMMHRSVNLLLNMVEQGEELPELFFEDGTSVTKDTFEPYIFLQMDAATCGFMCNVRAFVSGMRDWLDASLPIACLSKQHDELNEFFCGMDQNSETPLFERGVFLTRLTFRGYDLSSLQVQWLLDALCDEFSRAEQRNFIEFISGAETLPCGGISGLPQDLCVVRKTDVDDSFLPTCSTCFFQLNLPAYSSRRVLNEQLRKAVTLGRKHFNFT